MHPPLLRQQLTFGFETTFTLANWWESPGFRSECETVEKTELMRAFSSELASVLKLRAMQIKDQYQLDAFQILDAQGLEIFRFTSEPGSMEVNTPPVLIDHVKEMITPLLEAAASVGLVPYRTWWYGIKTGTGGGCHLNMAGFTEETNPFKNNLGLVLKYFSYYHNRPSLHFPFMGPDIGFGGNCMRIDEQSEVSTANLTRFEEAVTKFNSGWKPQAEELYHFFAGFALREVKHSTPTLRKMKSPWYLIEDRAIEMPRTPDEFLLLCELRMRILEKLELDTEAELPKKFGPSLHEENLAYSTLWKEFSAICDSLSLDAEPYRVFFERQFPKLEMGEGVPQSFFVREGKRERKVLGVQDRMGTVILNKKIDTRYKRVELHVIGGSESHTFRVNGKMLNSSIDGTLIDLLVTEENNFLDVELCDGEGTFIERAVLDLNSFLFVAVPQNLSWIFEDLLKGRYFNFETKLVK